MQTVEIENVRLGTELKKLCNISQSLSKLDTSNNKEKMLQYNY